MKSAPNYRRWLIPGGWLLTAAAAFSIGRMSSWLDEPINPNAAGHGTAGTAGSPAGDVAGGAGGGNRVGLPTTLNGERGPAVSIAEITGGQPLEDWLKKLMAQDDEIYRMQHFVKLFESLNTVEDIMTALKVLTPGGGRGRGGMRFTEYSMLLQKLTQIDPKAAVAYAAEQKGGERFMAQGTVLRTWAKTEPEAALAWAKENGAPQDPNANADENDRRGGNENFALASVISQMAKTSLDRAIQEATSGDLGRIAGRTADSLLNEAFEQRGADGAKKIAESLPEGQFRNDFIQQLAQKLAKDDPAGTGAWALNMPTGDTKRRALGETVDQWLGKDQAQAIAFVNNLPVGPDSDSARGQVAQKIAATDSAQALKTISMMSDPERQARTVREIAGNLARKDVAVGQQFVMQSPLADDAKAQLAQQISQPRDRGGDFRARFGGGGPGGPGGGPRRN
jgi:hypothetical protein